MRRIAIAAGLAALPALAFAQQPTQPPPSAPANFAGVLAQNLSQALAEADALRAQVADLQRQLDAAKKPEAPKP